MLLTAVVVLQDSSTSLVNAVSALKTVSNALMLQLALSVLRVSQLQPQTSAEDVQSNALNVTHTT